MYSSCRPAGKGGGRREEQYSVQRAREEGGTGCWEYSIVVVWQGGMEC